MSEWIKREDQEPEIKADLSARYLAWDGKQMGVIRHMYDDVWFID